MKTKFTVDETGNVTMSYDIECYDGTKRIDRVFTCSIDGGYVREYRNGEWKQVCDSLSNMGNTLTCASREKLISLIRREYRSMRRAESLIERRNQS